MTTLEPTAPLDGVKLVNWGSTLKLPELVATSDEVTTEIRPFPADVGTTAEIEVEELTVKLALTPLNKTSVTPLNPVPVMTTVAPTFPLEGEKPDTAKPVVEPVTVKSVALSAVPAAVVT